MDSPRIREPAWVDHALKVAERASAETNEQHKSLATTPGGRASVALTVANVAHCEALIALQGLHVLAKAIASLETSGAIDGAIVDSLSEMAERMELIEQRGFRYVGRYQAANDFKRGDVVTYRGSLWCCLADAKTGERPNTSCHKWTLMLNGKEAEV